MISLCTFPLFIHAMKKTVFDDSREKQNTSQCQKLLERNDALALLSWSEARASAVLDQMKIISEDRGISFLNTGFISALLSDPEILNALYEKLELL
ncbi:MAG: hypothetical protein WA432_04085 [Candidatus Babeliaceae bacterium]